MSDDKEKMYQFSVKDADESTPPHTLQIFIGRAALAKLLPTLMNELTSQDGGAVIELVGNMNVETLDDEDDDWEITSDDGIEMIATPVTQELLEKLGDQGYTLIRGSDGKITHAIKQ